MIWVNRQVDMAIYNSEYLIDNVITVSITLTNKKVYIAKYMVWENFRYIYFN